MPRKRANKQGGLFRYLKANGSLKSAVWYGQYYNAAGKQIRKSTGERIKQRAEAVLRKWITDSERGLKPSPETHHVTYENLRDALLESYRVKGNKSLQTLADGTETIFPLSALDNFFSGKKALQINPDLIRSFIRIRQKEDVGNATINNSLSLLRRMFNLARKEGKLQVVPHIELLKPPPARTGFIEPKDFARLLAKLPAKLRPLIVLLYYCGVRIGEAKQIEWSSVDLGKALIVLQEGQTKNDEQRIIPLPDVLVAMLRSIKRKEGLVFDATDLRREWNIAVSACGPSGIRIHDMRRSAIRNMMLAGAQQAEAMKISGHKTASVFQRYNIIDTVQIVDVMKRVQEKIVPAKAIKSLPEHLANGESLVRVRRKTVSK